MATIRKKDDQKKPWQAIIKRKGKQIATKSFARKKDATNWSRKVELAYDKGEWDENVFLGSGAVSDLLEGFKKTLRKSEYKERVVIEKIEQVFLKDDVKDVDLEDISSEHINEYMDRRRKTLTPRYQAQIKKAEDNGVSTASIPKEYISEGTLAKERQYLSNAFQWGAKTVDFKKVKNPVPGSKPPSQKKSGRKKRLGSEGDRERLLQHCKHTGKPNKYLLPFVTILMETGMRRGELMGLTWGGIDYKNHVMTFESGKQKDGEVVWRSIPLTESARMALLAYQANPVDSRGPRVFQGVTISMYRQSFNRAAKRAGLKGDFDAVENVLRSHDLRREANSSFLESGMLSQQEVMAVMGHKSIQTNTIYQEFDARNMAAKINDFSSIRVHRDVHNKLDQYSRVNGCGGIEAAIVHLLARDGM